MGIDMTKESNGNVHASVTCENRESTEIDSTNDSNGDMPVIMPCQMPQECTETNITDESSGNVSTAEELLPILCNESGEGLPYAPEDFPLPGDKWRWRVGKRVAVSGDYKDRYLYLPKRLHCQDQSLRRPFASKLSVERYIRTTFPNVDVDAFFNSFSWKVPSKNLPLPSGVMERRPFFTLHHEEIGDHSQSDSPSGTLRCKARNKLCSSLIEQPEEAARTSIPCDFCCIEPGFCRDCCCILCFKVITSANGGYNYIKCEALSDEGHICGHLAHLDCALQAYMAGTVGGSIGLDAQYYCRRCDAKTELVSHVTRLFEACKSIDSQEEQEKALKLGSCLLRGSLNMSAKILLNRIQSALTMLRCGTRLDNIQTDESKSVVSSNGDPSLEGTLYRDALDFRTHLSADESISFDFQTPSVQLDDEIDQILRSLRKSQELEYRVAEEQLNAQKSYLHNLYQQLKQESSQLACQKSPANSDDLLNIVLSRNNQIKHEVEKLKEMKEIAKGFGMTPKSILKGHFSLDVDTGEAH